MYADVRAKGLIRGGLVVVFSVGFDFAARCTIISENSEYDRGIQSLAHCSVHTLSRGSSPTALQRLIPESLSGRPAECMPVPMTAGRVPYRTCNPKVCSTATVDAQRLAGAREKSQYTWSGFTVQNGVSGGSYGYSKGYMLYLYVNHLSARDPPPLSPPSWAQHAGWSELLTEAT